MDPFAALAGESPQIVALRTKVKDLLQRQAAGRRQPPVLIEGETGSGKGLLARTIHRAGPRASGPFIDVNCAAIPETLLEAELFGYERGAFTDARQSKPGLFQLAHGGTLFLDEIGLLPSALQAKLLKALDERSVRRLGSTRTEAVDAWILTATNEELAAAVAAGRFRSDLFHRLAVLTLTLPPLRERRGDVLLLATQFLAEIVAEYRLPSRSLSADAQHALRAYRWPGNVRELHNVIERAAMLSNADVITAAMLGLPSEATAAMIDVSDPHLPTIEDVARRQLEVALAKTGWNISRTATMLHLSRNTVRARIERFGLAPPGKVGRELARDSRPRSVAATTPLPVAPAPPEASPPAAAPRPTLHWDRRRVARLRVGLDPGEEAPAMQSESTRWLEVVTDKVQGFGGYVENITPSMLEASFGLASVEDPVRLATIAALAIRRAIAAAWRPADPPPLRAVVHAADVLVASSGAVMRIDGDAQREITTLVDAHFGAAGAGEITIDSTTAAFLRRQFALKRAGLSSSGSTLYHIVGQEPSGNLIDGKASVFVGRHQELETLQARLATARAGSGQLVGIIGDAGLGKSRLLSEFSRDGGQRPLRVLEAGSAYASITPYRPVIELLSRFFGIAPDDDVTRVRERVIAATSGAGDGWEPFVPAFLALLDVPDADWERLDPVERRHRTREAVKRLLIAESRVQPVLAIFEDVHWMDSESQGLLEGLVTSLPIIPIMLVLTYRPEFRHGWTNLSYYTQLHVPPLAPAIATELLDNLLGRDPSLDPLKRRVVEWTDGNPFFLEESVHALVETGVLAGTRGAYRATDPVPELEVPPTVQDVLAARIDRLGPDDKDVIQTAATIGADVPVALLEAVADVPSETLNQGLRRLEAAELLYESTAVSERNLVFKHALTREVAYRSLLPERRRHLHARIATALETTSSEHAAEHLDRVAHHAVRGGLWEKAVTYLVRAGDRALESAAAHESAEYLTQALDALRHLPEAPSVLEQQIDVRLRLRDALWPLLRLPAVLEHLRAAEALAANLLDPRREGWIACYLCQHFWAVGDLGAAVEAGDRALEIARTLDNTALLAEAGVYRGLAALAGGELRRAATMLSEAAGLLDAAIARDGGAFPSRRFATNGPVILRSFLVGCLAWLGDFGEAIKRGDETTRLAQAIGTPFAQVAAAGGLGTVYLRRSDPVTAVEVLEPAMDVCRTHGLNHWIPTLGGTLGAAYVRLHRLPEGVALLEECVAHGEQLGLGAYNTLWVTYLGEAYLAAGRRGEALSVARRALSLARRRAERAYEALALRLLAELAATDDVPETAEAESRYQEALAAAVACGMRPLVAHCHLGLGRLYARIGDAAKAEASLSTAADAFRTLDMPWPAETSR